MPVVGCGLRDGGYKTYRRIRIMGLIDWIIIAVVLAAIGGVVASAIRKKKSGKGGCDCGCDGCPSASACHACSSKAEKPEKGDNK